MSSRVVMYGEPVLRENATPVATVDESIRALAADLLATMYAHNGLGLAAEQIGRTECVCVVEIPPDVEDPGRSSTGQGIGSPLVLINPEILASDGIQSRQEGCLSFPEIFVTLKRAATVTVKYLSLDNRWETLEAEGLLARAIQHEVDHLHGVLLVDRMSAVQKVGVSGKLKRLKAQARSEA